MNIYCQTQFIPSYQGRQQNITCKGMLMTLPSRLPTYTWTSDGELPSTACTALSQHCQQQATLSSTNNSLASLHGEDMLWFVINILSIQTSVQPIVLTTGSTISPCIHVSPVTIMQFFCRAGTGWPSGLYTGLLCKRSWVQILVGYRIN